MPSDLVPLHPPRILQASSVVVACTAIKQASVGPPAAFMQPARLVGVAVLGVLELEVLLVVVVPESPPPQAAKVHINSIEMIRRRDLLGVLMNDFIVVWV